MKQKVEVILGLCVDTNMATQPNFEKILRGQLTEDISDTCDDLKGMQVDFIEIEYGEPC